MPTPYVLLSCEHARNYVPPKFHSLFEGDPHVLTTHRGYDLGALDLAQTFKKTLNVKLFAARLTRLLGDHNRTEDAPTLFSKYARQLSQDDKESLLNTYHRPFWREVETDVWQHLQVGRQVVHLAIHSFTPVFKAYERPNDVGLLYDPRSAIEQEFCRRWQQILRRQAAHLNIHRNRPYSGATNALTTAIRNSASGRPYLGMELELNQRHVDPYGRVAQELKKLLADTAKQALMDVFGASV